MAFDGITVSSLVSEFKLQLEGGRINKISQPENDEVLILIKGACGNKRLLLSANPSLPLAYITEINKPSPISAPNFLMVLRKHLSGGKIIKISQPGLERCIHFDVEHFDEMGDKKTNTLLIELMGKYSNIILVNDKGIIIDAIKHVPRYLSSVREVIPGRDYFLPDNMNKLNPLDITREEFANLVSRSAGPLSKWIVNTFTGISPQISSEIIYKSQIDTRFTYDDLNEIQTQNLITNFITIISRVKDGQYSPTMYLENDRPVEFSAFNLTQYEGLDTIEFDEISQLISNYYERKAVYSRVHQKSTDLRMIVNTALERTKKKYSIQANQLEKTKSKDKYRIYGELLQAYGYSIGAGAPKAIVNNYYDNDKEIEIPLDTTLTPLENANHYFDRYNKLKRTEDALSEQIKETQTELERLESIKASLEICENEGDLSGVKKELVQAGYIKEKSQGKKKEKQAAPLHFKTADGFDIYVGKNNIQNDYVTNTLASKDDIWFHSKKFHGSHVILKNNGCEIPDNVYEICASLAAYYSSGREQNKVEIDYVKCKELHKVKGAALGFVIYHTNYSITVKPYIDKTLIAVK